MCCIVSKPMGVALPPKSTFVFLAKLNRDGFGYVSSNGSHFRSTDFDAFYEHITTHTSVADNVLIHFRYGTHGSSCESNCHPFHDKDTDIWFMHNGVLPIPTRNNKTDSETAFRRIIVPAAKNYGYNSFAFWHRVRQIAGSSRFAFMKDGNVQLIGQFYLFDGCEYSNPSILW